jgi:hypothetical protein
MHIPLYQALKAIKMGDAEAGIVVERLEEHIAVKISEANKGLEARLTAQNWLLGFIGVLIAITGLAPVIAKLF